MEGGGEQENMVGHHPSLQQAGLRPGASLAATLRYSPANEAASSTWASFSLLTVLETRLSLPDHPLGILVFSRAPG